MNYVYTIKIFYTFEYILYVNRGLFLAQLFVQFKLCIQTDPLEVLHENNQLIFGLIGSFQLYQMLRVQQSNDLHLVLQAITLFYISQLVLLEYFRAEFFLCFHVPHLIDVTNRPSSTNRPHKLIFLIELLLYAKPFQQLNEFCIHFFVLYLQI